MTTALPHLWPSAPLWLWLILFWGGLTITAYAILFLIYDFTVKPCLAMEVEMIPLTMLIFGFLLIIGGIIYHLHKKPNQQTPIKPISETGMPAPPRELPKPSAQEVLRPSAKSLSPQEIDKALDNAPLLQKPEIAKHYIGIRVLWEGRLASITKLKKDDNVSILLGPKDGPNVGRYYAFDVDLNNYPGLGLLKAETAIKFEGVIDDIKDSYIDFRDVTIISY